MRVGLQRHAAATLSDGRIIVVGGAMPNGEVNEAAFEYDPASDAWSIRQANNPGRHYLAAAAVGDKVYVIGGLLSGGTTAVADNTEWSSPSLADAFSAIEGYVVSL